MGKNCYLSISIEYLEPNSNNKKIKTIACSIVDEYFILRDYFMCSIFKDQFYKKRSSADVFYKSIKNRIINKRKRSKSLIRSEYFKGLYPLDSYSSIHLCRLSMNKFLKWLQVIDLKYKDNLLLLKNNNLDLDFINLYLSNYTYFPSLFYTTLNFEFNNLPQKRRKILDLDSVYHGISINLFKGEKSIKYVKQYFDSQKKKKKKIKKKNEWQKKYSLMVDSKSISINYIRLLKLSMRKYKTEN